MNFLRVSFFLLVAIALSSCGDNNNVPDCEQADWVGTYSGTLDCDGATEDVTVTITASGTDAIVIKYETTSLEVDYDPITITVCDLNNSATDSGITATVDAKLDTDNLTIEETLSDGTTTSTCNITATRN